MYKSNANTSHRSAKGALGAAVARAAQAGA
jgi:hypothetical protein